MNPEPIVTFENVSFSYQDREVLHGASLEVHNHDFIGIIGPNGGGKTTLLKLIMGFLKPNSGKIKVFGETPGLGYEHIGYVPQMLHFDKQFPISALELVLGGRLSHLPWYGIFSQADKQAAIDALDRVGLSDFHNTPFGNLSSGQTQRALIARALVGEPKLLLLDEPTANVDSQAEADIHSILQDLSHHMSILMVTHDLQAAIDQVHRVLCVQGGYVSVFSPKQVCDHFTMGLYHKPLRE